MQGLMYRIHIFKDGVNQYHTANPSNLARRIDKIIKEGGQIVSVGTYSIETGKTTFRDIAPFIMQE